MGAGDGEAVPPSVFFVDGQAAAGDGMDDRTAAAPAVSSEMNGKQHISLDLEGWALGFCIIIRHIAHCLRA